MNDRKRIRRIQRLLKVSETRRDAAQAALAVAQARAAQKHASVDEARARLDDGAARMRRTESVKVSEFADAHAYVCALRHEVVRARTEARVADDEASERREVATGAHREVRKMEIWGESTEERMRIEQARIEQLDNDELAAMLVKGKES